MNVPFLGEQLKLIYFLQEMRGPIVDDFLWFLNFFDTAGFTCLLLSFIWIGISWKWGARLGVLLIISGVINAAMKSAFCLPRPFFYDPSLAIVQLHDYGFPSGGAQTAMLLGCLLISVWKSRLAWGIGLFYVALISVSRMALGVHFPMDVLGGWAIGAALFIAFVRWGQAVERWTSRYAGKILIVILGMAPLAGWLAHDEKALLLITAVVSLATGLYLSTKFNLYLVPPREIWKKIALGLLGVASAGALTVLASFLPLGPALSAIIYVATGSLWVTLFMSPVVRRFLTPKTNRKSAKIIRKIDEP